MHEQAIVNTIVHNLRKDGYTVATEVANFYRSADVVAVDNDSKIWIIECKVSDMKRALEQLRIHKMSADRVFIGTSFRKLQKNTLKRIRDAAVGLIFVMPNGRIKIELNCPKQDNIWAPAKEKLLSKFRNI